MILGIFLKYPFYLGYNFAGHFTLFLYISYFQVPSRTQKDMGSSMQFLLIWAS
jgi:hypothetical protein